MQYYLRPVWLVLVLAIVAGYRLAFAENADRRVAPKQHWSFQPVKKPSLPAVRNAHWIRNGIDQFVLHRLEAEGLVPSPEADRATLIRRVSLDLP